MPRTNGIIPPLLSLIPLLFKLASSSPSPAATIAAFFSPPPAPSFPSSLRIGPFDAGAAERSAGPRSFRTLDRRDRRYRRRRVGEKGSELRLRNFDLPECLIFYGVDAALEPLISPPP